MILTVRKEDNYLFEIHVNFLLLLFKEYGKFQKIKLKIIKKVNNNRDIVFTESDTTAASCIKSGLGVAIIPESVAIDHKLLFKRIAKPSLNRNIFFIKNNKNISKINTTNEALKNAMWL